MTNYLKALEENKKVIVEESFQYGVGWNEYCTLNMSTIYDKLIKEAAKCRYYASDLIIDIRTLERAIEAKEDEQAFFGFRESGVDHGAFIDSRLESAGGNPEANYRAIWMVDLKFDPVDNYGDGWGTCKLYELYQK